MGIDKNVHVTLDDHIDDIGYSLKPGRVDCIVWRFDIKMICPGHYGCEMLHTEKMSMRGYPTWQSNALEPSFLYIVESGRHNWGIVLASFIRSGAQDIS